MFLEPERDQPGREAAGKPEPFPVPERIPLFPLPTVVFFPKTYLPLHIFEPRYRQMVADAAAAGQCIGMALLKEGWEDQYYENPAIFAMGCVGRLVSVQRLSDGRSNILLQGLERYEIREEFFDKPYREARVVLRPRRADVPLDPALRSHLMNKLEEYLQSDEEAAALQTLVRPDVSDEIFVNSLSTYLECTPLEKQFLLEAESLAQHARRLTDLIQFKLAERRGARGWG
ncbi:MAG TPA: LON peptidase substrate-binding domain-containing protein [Nitrospiraceae bacterium]|jgi:Lon protease-like protein|nr:LON peptidase substrate-binding domain-containing protein [Nitrospiraceae bacterium]